MNILLELQELRKQLKEETHQTVIITFKDIQNGKIIHDYSKDFIEGYFRCPNLKLTTLEHCPAKVVNGYFSCFNNKLTSLKYSPKQVNNYFHCENNKLTSLEHCPDKINNNFYCYDNKISSLKGIGKEYCFEVNGFLDLELNPIKSNILGLLYIKGLTYISVDNNNESILAIKIINKHLKDRDIVKCRQELIEAGLKEFAKF